VAGDFSVTVRVVDSAAVPASATRTLTLKVYLPYDVNGDGVVDMGDVVKIERIILGLDPATPAADVNNSGTVDVADIIKLERVILGIDAA
jgi:hypothetical protein